MLARMGKRVLRPGGFELTRQMLDGLEIGLEDVVVEFAPVLGVTARAALEREPRSYIGIERDERAAKQVRSYLKGDEQLCLVGRAEETDLPDASASVVYGEAMRTMQTERHKAEIVAEAARILGSGGRYGIHELAPEPGALAEELKQEIRQALSGASHIGARPLTPSDWRILLHEQGLQVELQVSAPMHLLEPRRLLRDEGVAGTLRFAWNVARTPHARRRIRAMRSVFRRYAEQLSAIAIVAVKQ
ncbi:MAG: methyltransferase domain-containing protein [Chloroflexi bacterium]|nr:methyltransferase domain-containing protein [Chloroflexota bacterium]